ncbi:MAG: di-trans,poly-cis-decaprenylcistransferase [Clostridia bacterium]|nr:di-trans,poly-cis-decaprenylcistransferase [Clostridia bacterium]
MDGNGRWAKARGMERPEGHKEGVKVFERVANTCFDFGLEAVTFYAFSTENWKRPPAEIKTIMGLLSMYLDKCGDSLIKREVRFRVIGDKAGLDKSLRNKIEKLENESKQFGKTLNVAINYGGRDEIVYACKKLVNEGKEINKENLSLALYTEDCVEPDMIIRTAGERRLSNFLLWQSSYSELYFTDVLWPDFTDEDLILAINDFYSRRRRYGGL